MTTIAFNFQTPKTTPLAFLPDTIEDWPVDDWKYADIDVVHARTNDLVRAIIDAAPLIGSFKRVLVDVKVQDLTPDIYSCIPGWHLDGAFPASRPGDAIPDHHHLCVLNGPLTEFINQPLALQVEDPRKPNMAAILAQIPHDVSITTCAARAITTFTSHDFHRGVRTTAPTRRLLVRLTETNTIVARNRPQKPSQGARA